MSVRCPVCGKSKQNKQAVIDHVELEHANEIPENMSTAQYIYSLVHGRDYGLCRVCGKPTQWNEKTGKPKQLCGSKSCAQKRRLIAQRNMIKVYGTDNLLKDPLHQEKMLANRKISGKYIWSDNKHTFTYTGSYEKFALEWLDKVYDYDPDDIEMPGPIIYYDLDGVQHPWITDMYLPSMNLVIEFKDGSYDKNTHDGFKGNRAREAAKDAHMKSQTQYNYTKITNKNMMSLVKIISMIRLNNIFDDTDNKKSKEPVIVINESVTDNDDHITPINYMTNDEIATLCEAISNNNIDEAVMSVANISPIVTNNKLDETLDSSQMMFGDGINSAITDSNCQGFTIQEDSYKNLVNRLRSIKETGENQMFSDQHDDVTWNPLDSSDNFKEISEDGKSPEQEDLETNPDTRTDIDTDPSSYGDNPVSSIAHDIISSNFIEK